MRHKWQVVVVPLMALALAGCSSDDDGADVATDAGQTSTTSTSAAPVETSLVPSTTAAAAAQPTTTTARPGSPQTTTTAKPAPTTASPTTASTAPPAGPTATITIQNFAFSPAVLNVAAGTTVTATNRDGTSHTWTADNGSWDSGSLGQNASFSHTFPTPGTFPYHCAIHSSMKATVNVS